MDKITEYVEALCNAPRFKAQVTAHDCTRERPEKSCDAATVLSPKLSDLLRRIGINRLYSHQCDALAAVRKGMHTAVATPTASGKTLIYNLPLLQTVEAIPQARALYIFPLKALAQDQLATFNRWARDAGQPAPDAAIYDGDTTSYRRKKIRQRPPTVLMTNPEMLHLSLLPFHPSWEEFFSNLHLVVIDEVHSYRGMLGNHMAQVMRRLRRLCSYYGASPVFIFTSATVSNPGQLAADLVGLPVHAVTENGAPKGIRHTIMIDPADSPSRAAIDLLKAALARHLRTIVYTPFNSVALEAHLQCAAAELPLEHDEPSLQAPEVRAAVIQMERSGILRRTAEGSRLYSRSKRPHRRIKLRGTGDRYRIVEPATGRTIGEIDGHRLYRETHPGAIYLHQGTTYRVQSIDNTRHCVNAVPADVDFYTRVRSDTDVEILVLHAHKPTGSTNVCTGRIKITDSVTGYDLIKTSTSEVLKQHFLDVPPVTFETQGFWFDIPSTLCKEIAKEGFDVMGSLHAAEHAAIAMMPLLVLADRNDIGGLSTPFHPQTGSAAIFIYDGVPGGAGFSDQAYALADQLLEITESAIRRCPCEQGCPACVHSPKCGSGNHPIDKAGAASLYQRLRKPGSPAAILMRRGPIAVANEISDSPFSYHPEAYGVFDLETQHSAAEVGGWHNAYLMRISCGVVYDSREDRFVVYDEARVDDLVAHLKRLDLVVGFNSKRFDYKVLNGYSGLDFGQLPAFDIWEAVRNRLGFRLSLDHIAEATLGQGKSGSGLDALRWWQEGRMDLIVDYCRRDVLITRDLYLFAREKGYLLYRDKDGRKFRIPL